MSVSASKILLQALVNIYPFLRWALPNAGDKYEYDDKVLAPLAMTSVSEIKVLIPRISTPLPYLPKDELPSQKWLALVVSAISMFTEEKKSTRLINVNESALNETEETEINSLYSIHNQIKLATKQEHLNEAVFQLLSALGLEPPGEEQEAPIQPENGIQLESNHSEEFNVEEELNKIDQQLAWLNENFPEESLTDLGKSAISLKADEVEKKGTVDKTSTALQKIIRYNVKSLAQELIYKQTDSTEIVESVASNPTLEDYEKLIEPLSIKPAILSNFQQDKQSILSNHQQDKQATLSNFQQDKVLAYMQVAGSNPVMLKQIEKIDSRLSITNEQYQNIVSQDSLEAALQEGRLYLADYSKLGALVNGSFAGIQKYMYAPVALFAVPPDKYPDKNLLPIAIRCQQTPGDDNPIFTPINGENWMTAKTVLQMADSNYHELISHLAQTHLFIEPFVLATNRCFTDKNHPVMLLLKPHFEGTILINYGAHKRLLAPEGPIDSLLGATIDSNCQLAIKEAQSHLANFNEVAFPRTLEKRGVNNSKQLPIYPYRDDGQRIWDAINQWVDEYLRLFYRSDNSVETDQQLQNWAGELLSKGHCHIGEEGNGRITTIDYLVKAISTVIFTASAQHAAVNFPQSGLMTYAPAFPLGCYSPAPTKPQQQQDFMGLLPPLDRAELQIQVLYLLGSVYYTKLGDYSGSSFQETKVKNALKKFQVKLIEIEHTILKEDSQRIVSYRYLLPSKIPQSINI